MAEFLVKVADERGHVLEQVESAQTESEVRDRFAQKGYLVYSVRSRGLLTSGDLGLRRRRIKLEPFVIFNEQFVTLIRAGLPIVTALDLLIRRQRNAGFKALLDDVRARVRAGALLSEAFEAQPGIPRIYTTTLLAGEKSGNLEEVLKRYIAFQRLAVTFRKKLLASLVYPALLTTLVVAMLIFLITYVVPQFAQLYKQLDAELPPLTVFMLNVGVTLRNYFPLIIAGLALLAFVVWRWQRTSSGAAAVDRLRLSIPVLGDIWLKYQIAIFSRMMATLLSGGLPLVPALETAGSSMNSRLLSDAIVHAGNRVREGRSLSASMEEAKLFPELAVEMTEVGESTGALPAMLTSAAEFYEEDVQTALSAAMSLIEPVILVFMGAVVGFVLLSLYMPIFSLGAGIGRH
ncbi:MAG TPA: type II secretion system F family protein [Terriglobales bacterium]|nr:type II secretion system F family protein [Terriglobales bacterium]